MQLVEEQLTDMGINAPKEHQEAIAELLFFLMGLYKQGKIDCKPFPETMLDPDRTSSVPDLLLFDERTGENPVILEVCRLEGERRDFAKIARLIDEQDYGIVEGFVYNYVEKRWRKYVKGIGEAENGISYSERLAVNLADFHQEPK